MQILAKRRFTPVLRFLVSDDGGGNIGFVGVIDVVVGSGGGVGCCKFYRLIQCVFY